MPLTPVVPRRARAPQCPACGYQYKNLGDIMGPGPRTVTIDVPHGMTEAQFIEAARRNYQYLIGDGDARRA